MNLLVSPRLWMTMAALFGATGVAAGAYGSHGFEGDETARDIFRIGVQYQMWHAIALYGGVRSSAVRHRCWGFVLSWHSSIFGQSLCFCLGGRVAGCRWCTGRRFLPDRCLGRIWLLSIRWS